MLHRVCCQQAVIFVIGTKPVTKRAGKQAIHKHGSCLKLINWVSYLLIGASSTSNSSAKPPSFAIQTILHDQLGTPFLNQTSQKNDSFPRIQVASQALGGCRRISLCKNLAVLPYRGNRRRHHHPNLKDTSPRCMRSNPSVSIKAGVALAHRWTFDVAPAALPQGLRKHDISKSSEPLARSSELRSDSNCRNVAPRADAHAMQC